MKVKVAIMTQKCSNNDASVLEIEVEIDRKFKA
jgi:hypothetical protein